MTQVPVPHHRACRRIETTAHAVVARMPGPVPEAPARAGRPGEVA